MPTANGRSGLSVKAPHLGVLALVAAVTLVACLLLLVDAKLVWAAPASFTAAPDVLVGDSPEAVVRADFNGDTRADIATANLLSDNVSVRLGNGDGTFASAQTISVGDGPVHLISADFNGDHKADLAVANVHSDNVSVLLGNGDGTFGAAQNFAAGDGPLSVTSADFNGDHKADLAVAYSGFNVDPFTGQPGFTTPGGVSVLLGNGDGTFGTAHNFAAGDATWFVTSADFNGDHKADLATANAPSISYIPNSGGGAGNVSVLLGKGDGTFGAAHNFGAGDTPVYLASADFNGDSKVDLAAANNLSNNVSVLSGNNDGTFQTARNFAAVTNPSALVGARFNTDSKVDLAVTNENSDNVSVLLNNTDTTSPRVESTSPQAGATGVSPTANVRATFSEGMNATTVNGTTFVLFKKGTTTRLGATVGYDATAHRATLDPTNSLKRGATYKAVVTTGAKDLAGNRLDQNPSLSGLQPKQWFFTVKH